MADDDMDDADFEAEKEEADDAEEVEVDDLEADAAADDEDEAVVEEEAGEAREEAEPAVAARAEGTRAESAVVHSPAAKEAARQRLASDVEAFLKRGGAIESVPQDVRADPPKKPESNYGRGSI